MAARHRLTVKEIKALPDGKHADGGGLWIHKRNGGAQWFLRLTIHGRRREMGLGGLDKVSLKEAREKAAEARKMVADGLDPIREREKARIEAERGLMTLAQIADDCFESRKAELKGDGMAGRWMSPLSTHVLPKLGKRPVVDLNQIDIRDTLKPIWHEKADVARKAMNRIGICLKHAAALGLDVDLQATEKAKALLGKSRHIAKNVPAMPWNEVPGFYASLDESPAALALKLLILTGARSTPIRFASLDQIDGDVWTIPGDLMKGQRGKTADFRIPLTSEAKKVIEAATSFEKDGYLFPGCGRRTPVISDMSMTSIMRRRKLDARPHGFRSSLRSWLADCTDAPHEVAEAILAHKTGNAVSRAYQRSDHLEQRRALLERWSAHCLGRSGQIVSMTVEGRA